MGQSICRFCRRALSAFALGDCNWPADRLARTCGRGREVLIYRVRGLHLRDRVASGSGGGAQEVGEISRLPRAAIGAR
jgi:hypothetical protein